jgi:NurA domain
MTIFFHLHPSEKVHQLLGNFRLRSANDVDSILETLHPIEIKPSNWIPSWVISIDGSHIEVDIKNGFPGAEAAYITVASVLLNVQKMRELDEQRPVNPKDFKTLERAESIDCALPGCNVIYDNELSAQDSLRKAIFEVFNSVQMSSNGETLLDTYEALLKYKPNNDQRPQQCPYEDCPGGRDYSRDTGKYKCSCNLSRTLYSTDALRIYERMNPAGTNGAIFSEIMQVWERVWVVHILRTMEAKKWLSSLSRIAIFLDGPLAVFGQPAWISQAIYRELSRLNNQIRKATGGKDLLLIGVEKTGTFVQHFEALDRKEQGEYGAFPTQSIGLITDSYVKRNIIFSDSLRPYGDATYFGRKFFYKTKSGARIVASLPFLSEDHKDTSRAELSQYPRLADAVGLLDQLVSSRYPNALMPLVVANAEAAIPLSLGNKVLENLAKELMSGN